MRAYKIVEKTSDGIRFIYHGVDRNKNIPIGKWLTAKEAITRDGSSYEYLSGFHFFDTIELARYYLSRFKKKENKIIVEVEVKKIRNKGKRTKVKLARYIKFMETI